jgi:hypothetical protein
MTYNQIVTEIRTLLTSHPMIKSVRFATPSEWLGWEQQPTFPVVSYSISNGSYGLGRELIYSIQFWFLDKSGVEGEFETDVISDMHGIANDIVLALRQNELLTIDDTINWSGISEKFEDYLSGVNFTINISTLGEFNNCDFPTI